MSVPLSKARIDRGTLQRLDGRVRSVVLVATAGLFLGTDQALCQIKSVDGPEDLWTGPCNAWGAVLWSTRRNRMAPLLRNGFDSVGPSQ